MCIRDSCCVKILYNLIWEYTKSAAGSSIRFFCFCIRFVCYVPVRSQAPGVAPAVSVVCAARFPVAPAVGVVPLCLCLVRRWHRVRCDVSVLACVGRLVFLVRVPLMVSCSGFGLHMHARLLRLFGIYISGIGVTAQTISHYFVSL